LSTYWTANWSIWVSAICVIAVYSYLFKDNVIYRVMMQVFIGINLGYQAIIQWRDVLYPQWWLPMIDGFKAIFGGPGSPWGALWALVGVIGFLFYLQLSRKYARYSKIAIGITIGIGAGLTFKSQFGQNIPQILDSFKPLAPAVVRPQPRTVGRLPGSVYSPAIDGSLAFFVTGNQLAADEVLHGVEVWRSNVPGTPSGSASVIGDEVRVPCKESILRFDRSSGSLIGRLPAANLAPSSASPVPASTIAVYRQPEFASKVELVRSGDQLMAHAIRNGVAEGVKKGDLLWSATYPEPIVSVQSFDGIALICGAHGSAIWEMPTPQARLTPKDYLDNWVSVITVVCVMSYFFFSFRRRGPITVAASSVGRWMLMIGFGAFFGNTVMTRMSFLLDRLMFLIDDWLRPFWHHLFG